MIRSDPGDTHHLVAPQPDEPMRSDSVPTLTDRMPDETHPPPVSPQTPANPEPSGPTPRRMSATLPWRISMAAGVALTAAAASGPLRYQAVARLHMDGPFHESRRHLLDLLWTHEQAGLIEPGWRVSANPAASLLELHAWAPDAERVRDEVEAVVGEFADRLAARNRALADRRNETRDMIVSVVDRFRSEEASARDALTRARDALPSVDPTKRRDVARETILAQSKAFGELRAQERDLIASLSRLMAESDTPSVDPADAEAAYLARADLQQDIEQHRLQLTLGRRYLQAVWQASSPRLDDLRASTEALTRVGSGRAARSASSDCREHVGSALELANVYRQRLDTFADAWTRTFVGMRVEPIDPHAPHLFAIQKHLHDLLAEFSFRSEKLIADMRDQVRALGERTKRQARNHQLVSQTTRAFQRFETDHRQFEFNASDVYRRNNFLLDAAIKSARRLNRRIKTTIASINERLEAIALERHRLEHRNEVEATEQKIREIRKKAYATIDTVLKWQADLDASLPDDEQYFRSAWNVEAAGARLAAAEQTRAEWEKLLESYDDNRRKVTPQACVIRQADHTANPTPAHLTRRGVIATAAGIATWITLTAFGKRRRNTPWP